MYIPKIIQLLATPTNHTLITIMSRKIVLVINGRIDYIKKRVNIPGPLTVSFGLEPSNRFLVRELISDWSIISFQMTRERKHKKSTGYVCVAPK